MSDFIIRNTRPEDFDGIIEITRRVYPEARPWSERELSSHLNVFPDGQFVAVEAAGGQVVGMAASLIVLWDDYETDMSWRDFTDHGMFTNHDEQGRTLYGAEIMVDPQWQGHGIGKMIYAARRELAKRYRLLRIRAGARLRGYQRYADQMSAQEYVHRVVMGELNDPTLTFQLRNGFKVLDVVRGYLVNDPDSHGWAAVIEWLNPEQARPQDYAAQRQALKKLDPHAE